MAPSTHSLAAVLFLLAGCVVGALPNEGRRCTENATCGPGTVCDPSAGRCVAGVPDAVRPDPDLGDQSIPDRHHDADADVGDGPSKLICDEPELALVTPSTVSMYEPAIRADGLQLIARQKGVGWMQTNRAAVGESFDAWVPLEAFPTDASDPNYFVHKATEQMIGAVEPKPRGLQICKPSVCETITVKDERLGLPFELDIDGPSIADHADELLLLFNVAYDADTPGGAYLAKPDDDTLTTWTATELATEGIAVNDPVISEDGTIIVYGNDVDSDLWMTRRESVNEPFGFPQRMSAVSVVGAKDNEPELYGAQGAELELFFRSDRATPNTTLIYRSVCTR